MSDSFVQLPTDSTGKKIDTRTESSNSEHRQVMVIGDPSTNAGVAPVDGTKGLAVDLSANAVGHGTAATAVRVELPTDGTGVVGLNAGSNTIGSLTANQSVNVAQMNGVTTSMGNGVSGTGVQRVAVASDNTAFSINNNVVDTAPATQNITAADAASTTASGQNSQSIITGTPTASSAASFAISGLDTVSLQITGTWVATLASEISFDSGTTWYTRGAHQSGTSYSTASFTSNGEGILNTAGVTNIRIRATAYTSGTATVRLAGSFNQSVSYIANSLKLSDATTSSQQLAIGSTGAAATNQAQVAGTATDVNSGNKSAGSQRVVLATDDINAAAINTSTSTLAGAVTSSVVQSNVKQINGVTTLMGNGATGTGSQRVTIASDNSPIAGVGAAATGAAVPSNAAYVGFNAATALPSAATAGNLTGGMVDKYSRQVVIPGTIRDLVGTQTTTISASTSETTIVTAAASVFNDITTLMISNTSATATRVDIRDTTAGSILFSIYVPAGDVRGVSPNRPLPQTSVNTNWTAQSSASVTDLRVYAVFDKNK